MYNLVVAAEQEQNDIDQSLDHIEQQQKELVATLEAYEKTTEEILGGQGSNMRALDSGPADTERDKKSVPSSSSRTPLTNQLASAVASHLRQNCTGTWTTCPAR